MLIKVLYEKEVWVEVKEEVEIDDDGNTRPMTAKDLYELRDNDPKEYDRILDSAFDDAVLLIGDDPTHGDCTFLDAEDD